MSWLENMKQKKKNAEKRDEIVVTLKRAMENCNSMPKIVSEIEGVIVQLSKFESKSKETEVALIKADKYARALVNALANGNNNEARQMMEYAKKEVMAIVTKTSSEPIFTEDETTFEMDRATLKDRLAHLDKAILVLEKDYNKSTYDEAQLEILRTEKQMVQNMLEEIQGAMKTDVTVTSLEALSTKMKSILSKSRSVEEINRSIENYERLKRDSDIRKQQTEIAMATLSGKMASSATASQQTVAPQVQTVSAPITQQAPAAPVMNRTPVSPVAEQAPAAFGFQIDDMDETLCKAQRTIDAFDKKIDDYTKVMYGKVSQAKKLLNLRDSANPIECIRLDAEIEALQSEIVHCQQMIKRYAQEKDKIAKQMEIMRRAQSEKEITSLVSEFSMSVDELKNIGADIIKSVEAANQTYDEIRELTTVLHDIDSTTPTISQEIAEPQKDEHKFDDLRKMLSAF